MISDTPLRDEIHTASRRRDKLACRVVVVSWALALLLGGFQVWASRHMMNPDGIVYLDIADAYLERDWTAAVNSYRSPLYPWLLALALRIGNPTPLSEFPLVHLVNFVVYVFELGCFQFLMTGLLRWRHAGESVTPSMLPDWALLAIGYSLFIWSSLSLIDLWFVTPDIAVAALVSLLAGIMVRIHLAPQNCTLFLSFGIVLALGYLTKAALLPLALIYVLCALVLIGDLKVAIPRLGVTLVTLLLIVSPYVAVLSISKGHVTLGDTGKLAYAFMVNKLPLIHWRGDRPGSGVAAHPSRQIHADPPVYEFDGPVRGTYPMEYDWSYWNAGMAPHFDLIATLAATKHAVREYLRAFVDSQGAILVAAVTLYAMSGSAWLANLARGWFLIVPGMAGLALYSPVWVEFRYIGGFVSLVWLGVFAGVRLQETEQSRRAGMSISLVVLIVTLVHVAMPIYDRARAPRSDLEERLMLDALRDMGLGPGSKIAIIGSSFDAYWARLGRVRIIAEIPAHTTDPGAYYPSTTAAQRFWQADARVKEDVMKAFAQTGARAVFAVDAPTALGWRRIDRTRYSVYVLPLGSFAPTW